MISEILVLGNVAANRFHANSALLVLYLVYPRNSGRLVLMLLTATRLKYLGSCSVRLSVDRIAKGNDEWDGFRI